MKREIEVSAIGSIAVRALCISVPQRTENYVGNIVISVRDVRLWRVEASVFNDSLRMTH